MQSASSIHGPGHERCEGGKIFGFNLVSEIVAGVGAARLPSGEYS
jgi:hypothetical protein